MSDYDHSVNDEQHAYDMLDNFLFSNVHNHFIRGKGERYWEITYEGDNYVVRHWDTGTDYHFRVVIEPHEWDSTQARADQEWD